MGREIGGVTAAGKVTPAPPSAEGSLAKPLFDILDRLDVSFAKEPAKFRETVRGTLAVIAFLASTASFIPFTSNFGGNLAATIIHDIIEPFRRLAIDASVDLALRPYFPTEDLNTRLLVSGVEAGALEENDLLEELARTGTRDQSVALAVKITRVRRFLVETADDIALARLYQRDLNTATIQILQDQERATIADLKAQRTQILAELRAVRTKVAP